MSKAQVIDGKAFAANLRTEIKRKVDFLKENYSITEGMPPEINLLNDTTNGASFLKFIENDLTMIIFYL